MSDTAYISKARPCDIDPSHGDAEYDGRTITGPWANMCESCYLSLGVGLGTGKGQRLIVGEAPKRDRQAEFRAAFARGASLDELDDIVGDGDVSDFV